MAQRDPTVEPTQQVRAGIGAVHACQPRRAAREDRRRPFERVQAERQADTSQGGEAGKRAIDLAEHVFVDRLIEAVTAGTKRVDDDAQDGGGAGREMLHRGHLRISAGLR